MDNKHPILIKSVGVIFTIFGIVYLLYGIRVAISFLMSLGRGADYSSVVISCLTTVCFMLVMLGISVITVISGIDLIKLKEKARKGTCTLAIFFIVINCLLVLFGAFPASGGWGGVFIFYFFMLSIMVYTAIIFFLTRPKVKEQFK